MLSYDIIVNTNVREHKITKEKETLETGQTDMSSGYINFFNKKLFIFLKI